jgi:hypothetical protein
VTVIFCGTVSYIPGKAQSVAGSSPVDCSVLSGLSSPFTWRDNPACML